MDLIKILQPLLTAHTASLQMNFSKLEDGMIDLAISPLVCVVKDDDSDKIQRLKAALSTPIRICGKPDELGAALIEHIETYIPVRKGWEDQLANINADIQRSEEASKVAKAKTPTKGSPRKGDVETVADEQQANEDNDFPL